jgi:hypothetical protein
LAAATADSESTPPVPPIPTRGPAALACRPFNTRASYDPISHKFLATLCELLFWTSKNALFCPFGTCRCYQFPLRAPSPCRIVTPTSLPRHRYLTPLDNGHWAIGLNFYKWAFPGPRRVLRNTTRQSVFDWLGCSASNLLSPSVNPPYAVSWMFTHIVTHAGVSVAH